MRMLSFAYALLLLCNQLVVSAPITFKEPKNQDSPPQLQITTFVKSQRYCKAGKGDFDALQMKLGLRYTNIGKNKLILYKFGHSISRVMISRSLENASSKRFIIDMSLTVFTNGTPSIEEDSSLDERFVVLPPHSSFEPERSEHVSIFLNSGENEKNEGSLGPGKYFLQVNVSTWLASYSLVERLRERWRGIGDLWYHDIASKPMLFKVEEHPTLEDCSPFADLLSVGRTNPNAKDKSGFTALMAAVYQHDEDLFYELLKKGADVNAKTEQGLTALTIAASHSETDFLKELIEHGADVNAKTDDGDTALLISVEKCDVESIKVLIDAGADVNVRNKKGKSPLLLAKDICDSEREIIELLKQSGVKR